jgi:glycosyltransferase 2 family protein
MDTKRFAGRRWLVLALKLGLVALVIWGVHRSLRTAWQDLEAKQFNIADWHPGWLMVAAVLYLAGQLPWAVFWWRLLRVMGQGPRLGAAVRAWYIGQIGKYAPGKAMVIIIRAALVRRYRTTATAATVAVFFETLTTMSVGAALAAILLALRFPEPRWLVWATIGLWAIVSGPTMLPVFRRLVRLTGAGRLDPAMAERLAKFKYGALFGHWLSIGVGWFAGGLSLWATLRAAGYTSELGLVDQWAVCTAAVGISVVAGFLSFLPAGLVMREWALLELLTPWFGRDGALLSTVVSRLLQIASELALAGMLWFIKPRAPEEDAAEPALENAAAPNAPLDRRL